MPDLPRTQRSSHNCNAPGCACGGAERYSVVWSWGHMKGWGFWARLQAWLQGYPSGRDARLPVWLGNRVSDLRYYAWRLSGRRT